VISVSDRIAASGLGGCNSRVAILTGMIIQQRSMFYSFVLSILCKYGNARHYGVLHSGGPLMVRVRVMVRFRG